MAGIALLVVALCTGVNSDVAEREGRETARPTPTRILPHLVDAELSVNKAAVQSSFEEMGFVFDPTEVLADHDLRITRGEHGDADYGTVVLYEIPRGLAAVSHIAGTLGTPGELGMRNVYRLQLLWTVLPEWERADDWLNEHLHQREHAVRIVGDTLVELEYFPVTGTVGVYVLHLKALLPG